MSRRNRGAWDRETVVAAALLAAAIVTLLIGAFEVHDQNALQQELAAGSAYAVEV